MLRTPACVGRESAGILINYYGEAPDAEEIVKRADGAGLLRCIRENGSVTWQKQSERHAVHFTHHDLTHLAIETTLGYEQGFFGLIASGWNIEDTKALPSHQNCE